MAYICEQRKHLWRCFNVNNYEKFRTHSSQQLQYWKARDVLFKKNVHSASYKTNRYLIAHNFGSDCVLNWSLKIPSH